MSSRTLKKKNEESEKLQQALPDRRFAHFRSPSMADHPGDNTDEPSDLKSLISTYSIRLWQKLAGPIPTSDSNLGFRYMRRSKKKPGLRLPFNSNSCDTFLFSKNTSKLIDILEDIMEHTISSLHQIRKSLLFWQSLAEATDAQKIYFMMFERGPRAFAGTTSQLLKGLVNKKTSMRHLCQMATSCIYDNITALTNLQICLASFLAELYVEVDKFGESLTNEPDDSLPALLVIIGSLFSKLESTLNHSLTSFKNGHSVVEDSLFSLQLEKVPEVDKGRSNWTENELENAIYTIYQNLNRFDTYLSLLVSKYQKPRRVTQYWFRYTCGAVGLSLCSIWLLRHSRLMGSSDIENWINEAKESTIVFLKDHVEQPLISIRDELFETFKSRQKNVMELEEVQLTADSLHRMLLAFSEQTKGQKFRENASDQEMLGIVMSRYEKELMHPIQNLIGGEIARALLIQIQKLKLDIETAMLELNQILKANEINFAVLAALPAFFLSFLLLYLVRAWATQDKGAEGKGRIARVQRRLLVVEVEKRIMYFQHCMDQGLAEEALTMFGLLLYSLDRLYKAVERHAKETGEWLSLRQDILDLGNSKLSTAHKLTVTSRMERVYDCLLPSTKRR